MSHRPSEQARQWSLWQLRCQQKTARGNVYSARGTAVAMATRIRLRTGDRTQAYWCCCCGLWHVGKSRQAGE